MFRFAVLSVFAACSPASESPPVASPVIASASQTWTVAVPDDCPHLIVDVVSEHEPTLVAACFTDSERTYFANRRGPPVGTKNEPDVPTRLVIEYVPLSEITAASARQ